MSYAEPVPDGRTSRRCRLAIGEDSGSIALLLLVILVGVSLGALLIPMIVTQDRSTRFDKTRVQALHAAQAGVEVMLGDIRQVTTGDASKLPCPAAPITGPVTLPAASPAIGVAAVYSVAVAYYTANPVQSPPPSKMLCSGGKLTGTAVPSFAQLTSTGTVPPAVNGSTNGRTLVSTYQLQTDNATGGLIQISPANSTGPPLCMDGGSATPTSGYLVLMQACSSLIPPLPQQVFAYRNDLTVQLVSSVTPSTPSGLCLTPASGGAVSLSNCPASEPAPYNQQWSYNQYGEYQTSIVTSIVDGVLGTQCINLASPTAGLQLTLATCHYTAPDPVQTTADPAQSWTNSPGVGVGAAVLPQWTNYSESGRCIYIPPTSAASDHLWSYPCKQDPWAGAVPPGQSFTALPTGVGRITSASGFCLTSPALGGWVTATPCSAGSQTWTVNTPPVATGAPAMPSSTKYTVVDGNGLCLGLGSPAYTDTWSALQTEACTGAADQKWNVPANALAFSWQNVKE